MLHACIKVCSDRVFGLRRWHKSDRWTTCVVHVFLSQTVNGQTVCMLVNSGCSTVSMCLRSAQSLTDLRIHQKLWFFLLLPFSVTTHLQRRFIKVYTSWNIFNSCRHTLASICVSFPLTLYAIASPKKKKSLCTLSEHTVNCTKLYVMLRERSLALFHYNGQWI